MSDLPPVKDCSTVRLRQLEAIPESLRFGTTGRFCRSAISAYSTSPALDIGRKGTRNQKRLPPIPHCGREFTLYVRQCGQRGTLHQTENIHQLH